MSRITVTITLEYDLDEVIRGNAVEHLKTVFGNTSTQYSVFGQTDGRIHPVGYKTVIAGLPSVISTDFKAMYDEEEAARKAEVEKRKAEEAAKKDKGKDKGNAIQSNQ